jgi:hypothetical protein
VSFNKGRALSFSRGEAKKSIKFIGVDAAGVPVRFLDEASGEIQMILEIPPFCDFLSSFSAAFGESWRGKLATSEKKKDVLTVGVLGVRAAGVFITEPSAPGENNPCAVGDCSHASTFEVSKEPVTCFP